MADFPYPSRFHLPVINSITSRETALSWACNGGYSTPTSIATSVAWPTNNLAFFVPFVIWAPYLVKSVFWTNGATASGNVDCGVYTSDASELLFSAQTTAGTTIAQSGVSTLQTAAVGPVLLEPGTYYMALVLSSTSGTARGTTTPNTLTLQAAGCAQAANGSLPLAASQTLATISSFGGVITPAFGISSRASTLV